MTTAEKYQARTFANLLDSPLSSRQMELLRAQLLQGRLVELDDGDLLVALRAPYVPARFGRDGRERWRIQDPVLPDPWADHIRVTDST